MESKRKNPGRVKKLFKLLIEPVWNRNSQLYRADGFCTFTFNRTSMESKLFTKKQASKQITSFNRTSMESKQFNKTSKFRYLGYPFNRTSMESKHGRLVGRYALCRQLLIEPVWNRNIDLHHQRYSQFFAFNRTSMESKPSQMGNSTHLPHAFNRTSMESKLFTHF